MDTKLSTFINTNLGFAPSDFSINREAVLKRAEILRALPENSFVTSFVPHLRQQLSRVESSTQDMHLDRFTHLVVLLEHLYTDKFKTAFESLDKVFNLKGDTDPERVIVNINRQLEEYLNKLDEGKSLSGRIHPQLFELLQLGKIPSIQNFSHNQLLTMMFSKAAMGPGIKGAIVTFMVIVSFLKKHSILNYENLKKYSIAAKKFMGELLAIPNPIPGYLHDTFLKIRMPFLNSVDLNNVTIDENKIDLNTSQREAFIKEISTGKVKLALEQRNKSLPILGCPAKYAELDLKLYGSDKAKKVSQADALYMLIVDAFSQIMFGERVYGTK